MWRPGRQIRSEVTNRADAAHLIATSHVSPWKAAPVPELDLTEQHQPFAPGREVAIVEVLDGKVWTVRPVTVVRDSADEIALWLAPGTVTRYPTGPQHGTHTVRQWLSGSWELADKVWGPPGKLRLTRPGDAFDVWMSPGATSGPHEPWYVNLQDPLRRVRSGFTTMDHILDIVVAPDLSSWQWKDQTELDHARQVGLLTPARAAEIRGTGRRVIEHIEAGQPPWDTSWAGWTPEPT